MFFVTIKIIFDGAANISITVTVPSRTEVRLGAYPLTIQEVIAMNVSKVLFFA